MAQTQNQKLLIKQKKFIHTATVQLINSNTRLRTQFISAFFIDTELLYFKPLPCDCVVLFRSVLLFFHSVIRSHMPSVVSKSAVFVSVRAHDSSTAPLLFSLLLSECVLWTLSKTLLGLNVIDVVVFVAYLSHSHRCSTRCTR